MVKLQKKASIIIRTLNEERWISSCLKSVFSQSYNNIEVLLVDNQSKDKTIQKASVFDIKVLTVESYLPGKAINIGIAESSGDIIVCLSGHCLPTSDNWLRNLIRNLDNPNIAGVYGRQEALSFSADEDKRDLSMVFGLDRRVQVKDHFFHNANSAIPKKILEKFPFDETVTNIEDRIWAKEVIASGYELVYEPEASVFHYHGINQTQAKERLRKTVRILENHSVVPSRKASEKNSKFETVAVIPVKGNLPLINGNNILDYTVKRIKESSKISNCILSSDTKAVLDRGLELEIDHLIERPKHLSRSFVGVDDVLTFSVDQLHDKGHFPDIIVYMSVTNPFRPEGYLDRLVQFLIDGHYDTVMPTLKEYRSCWIEEKEGVRRLDEGFVPHDFKNPIHIGISGLATAVFSDVLYSRGRLGEKVGLLELDDPVCSIDLRNQFGFNQADMMLDEWWENNGKRTKE